LPAGVDSSSAKIRRLRITWRQACASQR
jgi:hypothetical protein